ncbi:hypothetical protein EV182_008025, partial [Spiromyces aspiralis]
YDDYAEVPELQYVVDGHPNVFTALEQIGRLAATFALDQPLLPRIHWEGLSTTSLMVDGRRLTLGDVSKAAQYAIKVAECKLRSALLGYGSQLDQMIPQGLVDMLDNTQPGYSFVEDPRNASLRALPRDLMDHIARDPALRARFYDSVTGQPKQQEV